MSSLVQLARDILRDAEIIENHRKAHGTDSAVKPPPEVELARVNLVDAAHAIKSEAQTPETALFQLLWVATDLPVLQFVYTNNLAQYVPLEGSVSYAAIAEASGIKERLLRRFIRYAITIDIFTEPQAGQVAHSRISRILVTNSSAMSLMGMILEEMGPAAENITEALTRFASVDPNSEETNTTGYSVANRIEIPMYQYLSRHPERSRRFGYAMRFLGAGTEADTKYLLKSFPWKSFDRPGFLVVDVGGGHGGVICKVAEDTSHMQFIIQDEDDVVKVGASLLAEPLRERVSFMAHDFFTPQKTEADIYFFRWVFHNWSDKYAIRILQSIIPALRNGNKLLVYEHVLADGSDTRAVTKNDRYLDLIMLGSYNALERSEPEWKALFATADPRFKYDGLARTPGGSMALIQFHWEA